MSEDGDWRCGAPVVGAGGPRAPMESCVLEAGHEGWHSATGESLTASARAPMAVLVNAAKTAPAGTLFVMAQPVTHCHYYGRKHHDEVTLRAFTPAGILSRTLESGPNGWSWLHAWMGDALPWRGPCSYDDGWTPERARAWHEREHDWYLIEEAPPGA